MMSQIAAATSTANKTVVATRVGGEPCSLPLPQSAGRSLPVFSFPEPAAAALGLVTRYSGIRVPPEAAAVGPDNVDTADARTVICAGLAGGAGWLGADDVRRLLTDYGFPVCAQRVVADQDGAVVAAGELGYPLAVKIADGGIHKTAAGAIRLGVVGEDQLRDAFRAVTDGRPAGSRVLLQPMSPTGVEVILGAVQHHQFGPVVMAGVGGVLADVLNDHTFRLAPLSREEARKMLAELRAQQLLDGYLGAPPVDRDRLIDLLVQVGALVDDLPEIAELDLNPVICRGDQLVIVDARVRLAPAPARPDEMVRQLPLVAPQGRNRLDDSGP
jgi:acyl-CoA synthetase (NDP forming)